MKKVLDFVISGLDSKVSTNGTGMKCSNKFGPESRVSTHPDVIVVLNDTTIQRKSLLIRRMDCKQGFEFRLSKNFGHGRNHRISRNFGRNSFLDFFKILLNIFKLLFPKFSNFGGGEITEFRNTGFYCMAYRLDFTVKQK